MDEWHRKTMELVKRYKEAENEDFAEMVLEDLSDDLAYVECLVKHIIALEEKK